MEVLKKKKIQPSLVQDLRSDQRMLLLATKTRLMWNVDFGGDVDVAEVAVETVVAGLAAMIVKTEIDGGQYSDQSDEYSIYRDDDGGGGGE